MPLSTSTRLTQSSSVCGTQRIFDAIDSTAAHSDGYSPRCSCHILTARSRTSDEDLFLTRSWLHLSRVKASSKYEAIHHRNGEIEVLKSISNS